MESSSSALATDAIAHALCDPATYRRSPFHDPAVACGPIELCETHISWVALVGSFAYKVKKPVRYDFLDYGTLEKRRGACVVELELNRRWAPELYLGLSHLVRTAAGLYFDTSGDLIEYAVRMRRFAREDEFDALIARGAVASPELATFGAFIADQHEHAPVAAKNAGEPFAVYRVAHQNVNDLRSTQVSVVLERLTEWTEHLWPSFEGVLERRRAAGRVRECHGDLHCGNVVRLGNRLVPFDGIDFDPALRFIDVASDIAFLIMDLESHERSDLAMAFLSAWLEGSGDYDAGACLRFFLVYRALVRAKIATLRARQMSEVPAGAAETQAARYIEYAGRYAERGTGALVLMNGFSGSGKSMLAAALVPVIPAVQIRADIMRKYVVPRAGYNARASALDSGLYSPENTTRTYEKLAEAAGSLLKAGCNVIVDATFLDEQRRRRFVALGRAVGATVAIVACEASPDVLRARVAARRKDASEATVAVLEHQFSKGNVLSADEHASLVTVRTDAPVRLRDVSAAIQSALAPAAGG